MSSDLVHLRCSPEQGLGMARLCRSAKNPAKSPPSPHCPPWGPSVRMESEKNCVRPGRLEWEVKDNYHPMQSARLPRVHFK